MGEIEEDAGKKANFGFPDEPQVMTCGRGGGSQGSWCSRNSTNPQDPSRQPTPSPWLLTRVGSGSTTITSLQHTMEVTRATWLTAMHTGFPLSGFHNSRSPDGWFTYQTHYRGKYHYTELMTMVGME